MRSWQCASSNMLVQASYAAMHLLLLEYTGSINPCSCAKQDCDKSFHCGGRSYCGENVMLGLQGHPADALLSPDQVSTRRNEMEPPPRDGPDYSRRGGPG